MKGNGGGASSIGVTTSAYVQWSKDEDDKLRSLVKVHGTKKWALIAESLKPKKAKQCRRRWQNVLNVELKQGEWSLEEDAILLEGHRQHGNKWTEIAKIIGGRTDNAVKNRFIALKKREKKKVNTSGSTKVGNKRTRKGQAIVEDKKLLEASEKPSFGMLVKPNIKIDIPNPADNVDDKEDNRHQINFGLQSVAFSPTEMKILQELNQVLGPINRSARSLRTLSARGPGTLHQSMPSSTNYANDSKLPTPWYDPKLERTISKEVMNLLQAFSGQPSTTCTKEQREKSNNMHHYSFNNPLLSTTTATQQPSTVANSTNENGSLLSPQLLMPSTARIMQKLYAMKTGLTPKNVQDAVYSNKSLNFNSYSKSQQAQASQGSMDISQLFSSPNHNPPGELNQRRSPRLIQNVSNVTANVTNVNSSQTVDNAGTIRSDSTNLNLDLMPMPSGLRQQDFEFFLSALPDVPSAAIYDTPARDKDFPCV